MPWSPATPPGGRGHDAPDHASRSASARYIGLPKAAHEHGIAATAINMIRLDGCWTGNPVGRTHALFARLGFTLTT